tara:strand:- start:472 stop:738 length:267 start_codon:yes stop_codon:yes gene_type:complete
MKTVKRKFLLPVMVFLLAIVAAFATQTEKGENLAVVDGYIYVNDVCQPEGKCQSFGSIVCTHNGMQVFGKSGSGTDECFRTLYLPWQN